MFDVINHLLMICFSTFWNQIINDSRSTFSCFCLRICQNDLSICNYNKTKLFILAYFKTYNLSFFFIYLFFVILFFLKGTTICIIVYPNSRFWLIEIQWCRGCISICTIVMMLMNGPRLYFFKYISAVFSLNLAIISRQSGATQPPRSYAPLSEFLHAMNW